MYFPTIIPEDDFRKKNGWKGEWQLFVDAKEQHSKVHEVSNEECIVCITIDKHLGRLELEAKYLIEHLKNESEKDEK